MVRYSIQLLRVRYAHDVNKKILRKQTYSTGQCVRRVPYSKRSKPKGSSTLSRDIESVKFAEKEKNNIVICHNIDILVSVNKWHLFAAFS